MPRVIDEILAIANAAPKDQAFLPVLFGPLQEQSAFPTTVILFGAGGLGAELLHTMQNHGISVRFVCDNGVAKAGSSIGGVPVIAGEALKDHWRGEPILIASRKFATEIHQQLSAMGIPEHLILCRPTDPNTNFLYSCAMVGSQTLISGFAKYYQPLSMQDILIRDGDKVEKTYELLSDQKSKDLFVTKLALLASGGNLALLKKFITEFSEPYREFGMFGCDGTTEDRYYFNNDVLRLRDGEIYIDVGAFDGDTILTFVDACRKQGVTYDSIIAFEPDPPCFAMLHKVCENIPNTECHAMGLGDEDGTVRFLTSDQEGRFHVGIEHAAGEHEVKVVTLDNFLNEKPATLIKMDPGANIIPKLLKGARKTIARHQPKLALGVYHSLEAIYEIPLLVHSYNPGYAMYLRHGTYHLSDTDLFAIP